MVSRLSNRVYIPPRETRWTYDDSNHSCSGFPADKEGAKGQDNNCHRNGDDGEIKLRIMLIGRDNDQKLNSKAEEEEEIKLQQRNIDLEYKQVSKRS